MSTILEVELTVARSDRPDERTFTYYFAVPDAWSYLVDDELQLRAFDVAERMYAQLKGLKAVSTQARLLSAAEVAAQPWRATAAPPWEPSPCVTVAPDGSFRRERRP